MRGGRPGAGERSLPGQRVLRAGKAPWLVEIDDDYLAPDLYQGDWAEVDVTDRRPSSPGLFAIGEGARW